MTGIVAAEIRKLTSVRSTWILSLIGWVMVGLTAAAGVFVGFGEAFTGTEQQVADAVASIGGNSIIVLVVGLLAMTTEFRHGTAGRTFQLTPSRTRVMVAKLLAGVTYAVGFFVGALVVTLLALWLGAAIRGTDLTFGSRVFELGWQGLVGLVLTVLLGVAFGALVRAQVVAIVVSLVWVFVAENALAWWLPAIGRWMPFQALGGLFIPEAAFGEMPDGAFVPLSGVTALLAFAAWVLAFTASATLLLRYRDV